MKSIASLLIVTVLVVLCATSLEARRKNRRKYWRNSLHENFEIYHPKGLTVWYPKLKGVVGFGVEVFLNQRYDDSDEVECDICLNTTEVSYGKFIIHDDEAVIRPGDNLKYRFVFQMANGKIGERKSSFHVAANRVMRRQNQLPSATTSSVPVTDRSAVTSYEEDINMLETIVYDVFRHCNNVTEISKNLFLNTRPTELELDPQQLYQYTLNELQKVLPKVNWKTMLLNAFYYNDGVGFEVMTLIDKLKVLQMTKGLAQNTISDLDDLDQSTDGGSTDEDYNEIVFHDIRVSN